MCTSRRATREQVNAAWSIEDKTLDEIRDVIAEHGVWVGMIEEDDAGPGFAYTIGLQAVGHPEIIVFGLPIASMHRILNRCAEMIREESSRFADGSEVSGVLEGYAVRFRAVVAEESRAEYLGCACRYYEDRTFAVLQCVWPDKAHKFPGEVGAADFLTKLQPLIG
jgi:hypothetical protein